MKKKIISSALALSLVFGSAAMLPEGALTVNDSSITASAAKYETANGYEYDLLDDGTVYLHKYVGGGLTATVPTTLKGKKVTRLSNLLFNGNKDLTEITIPSGIKVYDDGGPGGNGIFRGCSALRKVNLPADMPLIPSYCFAGCTTLSSITLPANITEIGYAAFKGCTSLNNVTIPSKVEKIEPLAFESCTSLTKIYIPMTCGNVGYEKSSLHEWDPFKGIENTVTITTEPYSAAAIYANTYGRKCTIKKIDISGIKLTLPVFTCTGKAIKPEFTIQVSGITLKKGTDYTVKYTNNKNVGIASMTVSGKGGFKGTIKKTFKIKPAKPVVSNLTSPKAKKLKVTYKKSAGAAKYEIKYSTSKKFSKKTTKTVTTSKLKKTISGLKKGKTYYVKVRSFKKVSGKTYYSNYSKIKKVKIKK